MAAASKPAETGASEEAAVSVSAEPTEKTVRFRRSHGRWNQGVEAGFLTAQADELISRGVAVQIYPPIQRQPVMAGMVRK